MVTRDVRGLGAGKPTHPSSKTTLIIAPQLIMQQWREEINHHGPALQVFQYDGVQTMPHDLSDSDMNCLLSKYDVVLTSYKVLSREIFYSHDNPVRSLRREKKYIPRRSPLTSIVWWRVCVDGNLLDPLLCFSCSCFCRGSDD